MTTLDALIEALEKAASDIATRAEQEARIRYKTRTRYEAGPLDVWRADCTILELRLIDALTALRARKATP